MLHSIYVISIKIESTSISETKILTIEMNGYVIHKYNLIFIYFIKKRLILI